MRHQSAQEFQRSHKTSTDWAENEFHKLGQGRDQQGAVIGFEKGGGGSLQVVVKDFANQVNKKHGRVLYGR
jgi:hypothetical protein